MSENTSLFTVKRIIKILFFLCVIFVFCPTFFVSCYDKTVSISAMNAAVGIEVGGYYETDSNPILLFTLILPVVALLFLYLKKDNDKTTALASALCALGDFIVWLLFTVAVYQAVDGEDYLVVKTSIWLYFNLAAIIGAGVLSAMAYIGRLTMDSDLAQAANGGKPNATAELVSDSLRAAGGRLKKVSGELAGAINRPSGGDVIGYCYKCGKPIVRGSKFCSSCGTPVATPIEKPDKAAAGKSYSGHSGSSGNGFHSGGSL